MNGANWGGRAEDIADVTWVLDVAYSPPKPTSVSFRVKPGYTGHHVAHLLAKAWNEECGDGEAGPLAALDGGSVQFSGLTNTIGDMKLVVTYPGTGETRNMNVPDNGCAIEVVRGLFVFRD